MPDFVFSWGGTYLQKPFQLDAVILFKILQALGKAFASTAVSMTREIIFGVSLPIILPIFFGLDGLLWSFPVADLLTFIIAVFFIRQTYRELSESHSAV